MVFSRSTERRYVSTWWKTWMNAFNHLSLVTIFSFNAYEHVPLDSGTVALTNLRHPCAPPGLGAQQHVYQRQACSIPKNANSSAPNGDQHLWPWSMQVQIVASPSKRNSTSYWATFLISSLPQASCFPGFAWRWKSRAGQARTRHQAQDTGNRLHHYEGEVVGEPISKIVCL